MIRIVAAGALVALAIAVVVDSSSLGAKEGGFAAAVIVVALVILAIPINRLAGARGFKAFGVEIELADEALSSAPTRELGEAEVGAGQLGDDADGGRADDIVDLQLLLEAKLAYVAKHMLARDASGKWSSFITVGSLEHDNLLSREDAIAARRLLGLRADDIAQASPSQREAYLAEAKPFVGGIRATIFYNLVKDLLRRCAGTAPEERSRGGGRRADLSLEATVDGNQRNVLAFPAFASGGGYWHDPKRLHKRAQSLAESSDAALIVVPSGAGVKLSPPVRGVALIDVSTLIELAGKKPPDSGTRLDALLAGLSELS